MVAVIELNCVVNFDLFLHLTFATVRWELEWTVISYEKWNWMEKYEIDLDWIGPAWLSWLHEINRIEVCKSNLRISGKFGQAVFQPDSIILTNFGKPWPWGDSNRIELYWTTAVRKIKSTNKFSSSRIQLH